MITDTDITKLKTVFATKDDLKKFATKEDLKKFATKEDLKNFSTKSDLKEFATKEALADLRVEVGELRERVDSIDDKLDMVISKIDAFVGAVHEVREDNAAGAVMLYRHERHIQALADKAGITLPRVE